MTLALLNRLVHFRNTVFGLGFTLAGALMAVAMGHSWRLPWLPILLGFLGLRVAGMAFNELIDRDYDAKNPRTQGRVLPTGEMRVGQARLVAAVGMSIFLLACLWIGGHVLWMGPLVGMVTWIYPYTKRFTALCHFVVAGVLMAAPVMAFLAVTGEFAWPPFLLGVCAFCAIAGNDMVYALQDYQVDLREGLRSIPVVVGPVGALQLARLLYAGVVISLTGAGWAAQFPPIYYVGVLAVMATVMHYDRVLLRRGEKGIPQAFFRCNAAVATSSLLSVIGVIVWHILW